MSQQVVNMTFVTHKHYIGAYLQIGGYLLLPSHTDQLSQDLLIPNQSKFSQIR